MAHKIKAPKSNKPRNAKLNSSLLSSGRKMTTRSPEQYATLVSKALEIVLQHLLIPSNNLRGFDSLITALETERLPDLREKIITAHITHWNAHTNQVIELDGAEFIKEQLTNKFSKDMQHREDGTAVERMEKILRETDVSRDWMPYVLSQVII